MEIFEFLNVMTNTQSSFKTSVATFIGCVLAMATPALAQSGDRVSVHLSDPARPAVVKASLVAGSINVKGYEGKEVIVEAKSRSRESASSEGGMRRIPMTSTGLSVEEENNQVRIGTDSYQRPIDLTISVPTRTSLTLRTVNDGNIVVTGVDGEIDVDDINGAVTLTNISGNAIAHALNGRVHVTFNRINPQKPMSFSSMNGDIDVTFPPDLKANLTLRSDQGEVYSDFDVQVQAKAPQPQTEDSRPQGGKYRYKVDKTVRATVNGGGQEIQFKNFNGNIYIRKAGAVKAQ
jgi:DUF4097 and DUF4098 domain-containing protein YvlB